MDLASKVGAGCGVIVFNPEGKFLMMKRLSKHGCGTYAIVGGGIENGETFEQSAAREVKEEINIDIENIKIIGLTNNIIKEEGHHSVGVILCATIKSGEVQNMEPDKCAELVWCDDWDNLPKPTFTNYNQYITKQIINDYKKSVKLI